MTKKNILLLGASLLYLSLSAQEKAAEEKPWKFNLECGLTGSQAAYSNWASGGVNSTSLRAHLVTGGDFKNNRTSFSYQLNTLLGYQWAPKSEPAVKKTDDKLDLDLKWGYAMGKESNFYYNAFANFKAQFAQGYNEAHTRVTSTFFAPAYLVYGLGAEYKLGTMLDIVVAPISAKHTFVFNDTIWKQANYGITADMIAQGKHVLHELGCYLTASFTKDLHKNVDMMSKLSLFSNYLNRPENIAVNFDLGFNFRITKALSAGVFFGYVYDDKVKFDITDDAGNTYKAPRSQFKESLYIGLVYKM